MVAVSVDLSEGVLLSCRAAGHARAGAEGSDPVCAAVTVLVKTAGRVLAERPGVRVAGSAEQRGSLEMRVESWDPGDREWRKGVTAFLVQGLQDTAGTSPESVKLEIHNL